MRIFIYHFAYRESCFGECLGEPYLDCDVAGIGYRRNKHEVKKYQHLIQSLVLSTRIQEILQVDVSGSDVGYVGVPHCLEAIREGLNMRVR